MKLYKFEGKRVRLIDREGEEFEGVVGDYIYPEDNELEGVEGIILDYPIRGMDTSIKIRFCSMRRHQIH